MGKSLDQVFAEAVDGAQIGITIVTNQDDGIASYATGQLIHHARIANLSVDNPFIRPARLSTTGGDPLQYFFSDRRLDIDQPGPAGSFGHTPRQPFSANAIDKLGVSITRNSFGPPVVRFTLHSWGNVTFSVSMESRGNLLVGVGPAIGGQTDHAIYAVAFTGIFRPPK
jgi:hypothetical protein